ncbi:hypothetical protein AB0D13_40330 [Streptomyces sp. NPDC048430]|uniref:hypothetical protein n=1 Tax=Streptomyces sp. NPDC048430 TaxID=3155388 RepID=UPI00341CF1FE
MDHTARRGSGLWALFGGPRPVWEFSDCLATPSWRPAEAHLALGDIDAAIDTAHARMEGVTSARGTSTLNDLRQKLGRRRGVPVVADFLNYTAD